MSMIDMTCRVEVLNKRVSRQEASDFYPDQ